MTDTEEETPPIKEETPKIRNSVLDNFRRLTHDKEKIRVKSGVALLRHIFENKDTENGKTELKYALSRLVRGLGASKSASKIGFYTVLVALLDTIDDGISLADIFECAKQELHSSGSNSKSENADVFAGQILLQGALIRSDSFGKASLDEKKFIIEQLLSAGKKRDYLSLSSATFIIELCSKTNEKEFKSIVWPLLRPEVEKPWEQQTIDSLYLLDFLHEKFPNVTHRKFLRKALGCDEITSTTALKDLTGILLNIPRITAVSHPFYEIVSQRICTAGVAADFIREIDRNLSRFNYNRHLTATTLIVHCVKHLKDIEALPRMLNTTNYVQHTLQYFKTVTSSKKPETLQEKIYHLFNGIVETLKRDDASSDVKIEILTGFLFAPGIFIFEKITRSKIVQNIVATLDFEGVVKLSGLYRDVVSEQRMGADEKKGCFNNDRVYASQLLVKLLSHPSANEGIEWKTSQLRFLMDLAVFRIGDVSVELAASLKGTFFRALDLKLPKLKDLRDLLSNLIGDLDDRLKQQRPLRTPLSEEEAQIWTRSLEYVRKLGSKHKKIYGVFHALFLHMSLQLFNDTKLAADSLNELFTCYERVRSEKKHGDEAKPDDPLWIEVVVDLFLNLLSHKSSLLRNLIGYVFPHLCKYINVTAMHQILHVLDPTNEGNPLIASDSDGSDAEEMDEDDEGYSDESDEDDEDETEESVNDKLKMAVQAALGGANSDGDESVDLDEMDEDEGRRLDEALATAFKQFKPNLGKKSKKQKTEDEALTHFRVRVLDLIDLYLDGEPSMYLCLETMVVLLRCLEFSIKDEHQRPLSNRIRSTLKKLSGIKKFSSVEDVGEATLSDLFDSLLEKGTKNYFVMQEMNDKISECCLFIVACVEYLGTVEDVPKKTKKHLKKAIVTTISGALEMFFTKRESYVPYALFKGVMSSTWAGTFKLAPPILDHAFDADVRIFKRSQALELARIFFGNHRLLRLHDVEGMDESLAEFSKNCVEFFGDISNRKAKKEKYVRDLLTTLSTLKRSPIDGAKIDWADIGEKIAQFRTNLSLSKNTKLAYNKLCRSLGIETATIIKNDAGDEGVPTVQDESLSSDEDVGNGRVQVQSLDVKKKAKRKGVKTSKLKKETQILRMQSLSEGLSVDFAEADLKNEKLDDEDPKGFKRKSDRSAKQGDEDDRPKKKLRKSVREGGRKNGLTNQILDDNGGSD